MNKHNQAEAENLTRDKSVHKTPEYVLRAIKKYMRSEKGKAARKRYVMKHKKEINEYNKYYLRKYRIKKRKEGFCPRCLRPNPDPEYYTCPSCRKRTSSCKKQSFS